MVKGWIRIYRKLEDNVLWKNDEPFDRRSAWIDLLLTANFEDSEMLFDGKPFTVKRGQCLTSVRKLAVKWSWGKDRVLKFLRLLEGIGMITKDSTSKRTLVTIVNYEIYQGLIDSDEDSDKYSDEDTDKDSDKDTGKPHKKNIKNIRNKESNKEAGKTKKESNTDLFIRVLEENPNALSEKTVGVLREWMDYKDQRKEHYVEKGMKTLMNQIYKAQVEYGSEAVVDCVKDSMASNYQGIILDRLSKKSKTGSAKSTFNNIENHTDWDDDFYKSLIDN